MRSLLAALCLLISAQALANPDDGFLLGVGTHAGVGRESAAAIVSALGRGHFDAIRDDLMWSRVERTPGAFRAGAETKQLDRLVEASARAGRQVILILAYGNRQAGARGLVDNAAERAAFLRYVRWAVSRYRGSVRYFEVWNEWNIGLGSGPKPWQPGSAADYVELLRATYPVIKSLAPDSVVLGAGVAGTDAPWWRAFVRLGGQDYLDGVSLHPYVHGKGKAGLPERAIDWLEEARDILAAGPGRPAVKPFYITEIGWPSSTTPQGVDAATAADYLTRFTVLARARSPWIRGVWWYELIDGGGRPDNNEHNFGLFRRQGQAKPTAEAFAEVAALFTRFDTWRELDAPPQLRLVTASSGGAAGGCAVLWSVVGTPEVVALSVRSGTLARTHGAGAFESLGAGRVRVTASSSPQVWCSEGGGIELSGPFAVPPGEPA